MQPALREERPPLVTIWKETARKEPKTNKQPGELWQRASSGEKVRVCECLTSEKAQWRCEQLNLSWGKNHLKNSTKNPTTGIPGDRVDDRKNEWHQWRPSASVESWSPGGFNSSLWFLSSDVKNEGKGTRRLRFSEQLGQRLMRPRDLWHLRHDRLWQIKQTVSALQEAAQLLFFFSFKRGKNFCNSQWKKKSFRPKCHLVSSILPISNMISIYSNFLGRKVTLILFFFFISDSEQLFKHEHRASVTCEPLA